MRSFLTTFSVLCALTVAHGCTTIDAERQQLNGALLNARELAAEVHVWSAQTQGAVAQNAVETIVSYQSRAEEILDTLEDISPEARTGTDLAGVEQALREIVEFDLSRLETASQTGRTSIVQQFGGLAKNLNAAVQRVRLPG